MTNNDFDKKTYDDDYMSSINLWIIIDDGNKF